MNTSDTPRTGQQILTLTGLRFDANLGILDHEKTSPQPTRCWYPTTSPIQTI